MFDKRAMTPNTPKRRNPGFDERALVSRSYRHNFERCLSAVLLAVVAGQPIAVWALPDGAQVVAGSATVSRPSAQSMRVQQGTPRAIINWQGFSIGTPESVEFLQPSASSAVLNRVVGAQRSEIHGAMRANGQVFIVNPNGVLFGRDASVDVGGLVASTLDIGNQDFMDGRDRFVAIPGRATGTIVNSGRLHAADRGTVALLGGDVHNDGTIDVRLGTAALAAGNRVTLDFAGDGLTKVTIDEAVLGAKVRNSGAVIVDGGQAVMTARAADEAVRTVVNQSGVVRATSLVERDGRIVLDGGDSGRTQVSGTLDVSGSGDAKGGQVLVQGREVELASGSRIDARGGAQNGNGGFVETSGRQLDVSGLRVDAGASNGDPGTWLLDSIDVTIDAGMAASISEALASSNVDVTTDPVSEDPGQPGDITVAASIAKTGGPGTRTKLSLRATRDIVIQGEGEGGGGVQIVSSAGPLDVDLIARMNSVDSRQRGSVVLGSGASILTSGGHVLVSGGRDPRDAVNGRALGKLTSFSSMPVGVDASGATIDTTRDAAGAGSIELRGHGGTRVFEDVFRGAPGVLLDGAHVAGDVVVIDGIGGPGGASGNGGIGVDAFYSVVSGQRSLSLVGAGTQAGISINASDLHALGLVSIRGEGPAGTGVSISVSSEGERSTTIESLASGGVVRIHGFGDPRVPAAVGLEIDGGSSSVTVRANEGEIVLGGEGTEQGVVLLGETSVENRGAASGSIDIRGFSSLAEGSAPALDINAGVTISATGSRASIVLGAAGLPGNSGDLFQLGGDGFPAIETNGPIVIGPVFFDRNGSPTAADIPIDVGESWRPGVPFHVSISELSGLGDTASGIVVVGGPWQRQAISLREAIKPFEGLPMPASLTIQQDETPNSATGISIGAEIEIGDTLALRTSGPIDQDAPVRASSLLLLSSSGAIAFRDPANSVGTLAMYAGGGDASFVNLGSLTIGTVTATAAVGDASATRQFALTSSGATRNFFAQARRHFTIESAGILSANAGAFTAAATAGDLQLGHDIVTTNGEITLVSDGVFTNLGNAHLSAGGSRWTVWADTWRGEERGGLVPTTPLPNIYTGCAFGNSDCEGSSGVIVPATGNRFVYVERPEIVFTTGSASREYGDANPEFTIVPSSGLQSDLGDTVDDAVTGSFSVAAGSTSNVGVYPVTGSFSSPSGYSLEPRGPEASLTITPAMLTYVANPASREYGLENPPFSGDVTGFRNGESIASATTGTLAFTTPATVSNDVGSYPIVGGGLVANHGNYEFVQAAANATALTIGGATLVYVAEPASREYGLANPVFAGTVTGFRNGDTLVDATTGTLAFTSAVTSASNVGRYAIVGSGLTAIGNYLFVQAPSNATALTITPAILTYVANAANREYGLENPPLSGDVTGFRNGESIATATSGTLVFTTPAGSRSNVGTYPIVGGGLVANNGNYTIVSTPRNADALTITAAILTYVADPASRQAGASNPPFSGTVTGFRVGDTLATATSGEVRFLSSATASDPPGRYPIEGSGLSAVNYLLRQAASNPTALTVLSAPEPPRSPESAPLSSVFAEFSALPPVVGNPRNPETESTFVYERNLGIPGMCVPFGSLAGAGGQAATSDMLEIEWSRVRDRPNLSNCISLGDRDYCSDF